jgi:hypothetical protein
MKVNRFTKVQPAQYNPMSLEELMMVPMLKRKQHDQLLNNVAATRSALAQTDYMDMHEDKVLGIRSKLEEELQRQVDEVSANGINDTLRTDFINLNADYQNAVGPKGILGKAAAAKQAVAKNREELMANAVEMGHDPRGTATQFDRALQAYAESQKASDDITNMSAILPPNYEDLDEDLKTVKSLIGTTVTTERGEEGYTIGFDEQLQSFYAQTETGNIITEDNGGQLASELNRLSNKWLKESGTGFKSDAWNLRSHEDRQAEIINRINSMRTIKVHDNREQNIEFLGGIGADDDKENPEADNENVLYEETQELANTVFSSQSVAETRVQLKELRDQINSGELKGEELTKAKMKARELDYHMTKLDSELYKIPNYSRLVDDRKEVLEGLTANQQGLITDPHFEQLHKEPLEGGGFKYINQFTGATYDIGPDEFNESMLREKRSELYDINKEITEIEDNTAKAHTIEYVGYVVDKTTDTSAKWGQRAQQMVDHIASAGFAGNNYSIDSYVVNGKKKTPKNATVQQEIFRLIQSGVTPSIGRMYMHGSGNQPMVELFFNVNKDDEIADNTISRNESVAKGDRMVVRVNLGDFNAENATSIDNLFIKSIEEFGGAKGKRLAEAMRTAPQFKHIVASGTPNDYSQSNEIKKIAPYFHIAGGVNIHKDPVNKKYQYNVNNLVDEQSFGNYKDGTLLWKHVINERVLNDPETLAMLPSKLVDAFTADFIKYNPSGVSLKTIQTLSDAELDTLLNEFLKVHKDQPIQFNSKEEALLAFKPE